MRRFFNIVFFLMLSCSVFSQEMEMSLYSNPVLEEAFPKIIDRRLLKDFPVYPLWIAGKNMIDINTVVYTDTLWVNDTLLLPDNFFHTDSTLTRNHTVNSHTFEFSFYPSDTNRLLRKINISINDTTYHLESFAGGNIYIIDTTFDTSQVRYQQFNMDDFIVYDTLDFVKDTSVITKIKIVRRSTASVEAVTISKTSCFFDDFSFSQVYPNDHLWERSRSVYINNNYGRDPASIGVATFDALDERGTLYEKGVQAFSADTLMSKSINFDSATNVYLSFYYQPGGYGEYPEKNDSLRLEFYSPVLDTFIFVKGFRDVWDDVDSLDNIDDNIGMQPFRLFMIPITDTNYLADGFRFRFINRVSYETAQFTKGGKGNCDVWNIDYVYLAANRSAADTNFNDMAIVNPAQFRLTRYEAMPYSHFKRPDVQSKEFLFQMKLALRNNNYVDDSASVELKYYSEPGFKLYTVPYYAPIKENSVVYLNDAPCDTIEERMGDTTSFLIKTVIGSQGKKEFASINDTAYFRQYFKNYYAYDDGSAESGYSLSGTATEGGKLAYQFITRVPDTLWGISMFFNRLIKPTTETYYFYLTVWDNKGGEPGDVIFETDEEHSTNIMFKDRINGFHNYKLEKDGSPIFVQDTFYIGYSQVLNKPMSLGFDKNHVNNSKIFYNIDGLHWKQSIKQGSLMMRPIMGKYYETDFGTRRPKVDGFSVYPNPASDYIRIDLPAMYQDRPAHYCIYDIYGRLMYSNTAVVNFIDISSFSDGIYILMADHNGEILCNQKFSVIH